MLQYSARMPEDYGTYLFQLTNGLQVWAYYSSFPFPFCDHIRMADPENEEFHYLPVNQVRGHWFYAAKLTTQEGV